MRLLTLASILALGTAPYAQAQNVTETGVSPSFAPSPVETSVPEASGSPDEPVPGQGEYPAVQSWCEGGDNATYCPGPVRLFFFCASNMIDERLLLIRAAVTGCSSLSDFPG